MKHFNFDEIDDQTLINRAVKKDPVKFIDSIENKYETEVNKLCKIIAENAEQHKIIMLSGPSASGKTTTAAMIAKTLKDQYDVKSATISLDNFYLGENKAPLLEDGRYDYETVYALNIEAMHASFLSLIEYGKCEMPRFDFKLRRPAEDTIHVEIKPGDVAIVEGIHAMNPLIVDALPKDSLYKLYVSVENGIYHHGKRVLTPRQIRLSRRMVRDHFFRNSSPQHTLVLWDGVKEGEDKYLTPYKDTADMQINSFHSYEPCAYRDNAIQLFSRIKKGEHNYLLAQGMIDLLMPFPQIEIQNIPSTSLIREFIGGSVYL